MDETKKIPRARWVAKCAVLGAVLLTMAGQTQAAICYAGPLPSGNGSGSGWANATSLASALANTQCSDIRIRQGVYTATPFLIDRPLTLRGGYTGATPANPEARSPDASLTTLDGQGARRVLLVDGTTANGPLTNSTLLDGFSIVNGNASADSGGGLYCDGTGPGSVCSPVLNNIVFKNNQAELGGAQFNDGTHGTSSPTLTNVTFTGNSASIGGGLLNRGEHGTSSPALTNVTFTSNVAGIQGGAMSNEGADGVSSPLLVNVTFANNEAGESGGALLNQAVGSGISSPTLNNVTFAGNSAVDSGGALVNLGIAGGTSSPTLTNATFTNNMASNGGAMLNAGLGGGVSSPSLTNVTFTGNTADTGGAIFSVSDVQPSTPLVRNSVFWGNMSSGPGPQVAGSGTSVTTLNNVLFEGACVSGSNLICSGTQISSDPGLGPLQNNGGPTLTRMPPEGSSALGQGATCPATDQRGAARPPNGCDLGAVQRRLGSAVLSITVDGAGYGTVTGGIDSCASTTDHCTATYAAEDQPLYATLTATPASGYQFSGWSGACTHTAGACTVAMDQARSLTAQFTAKQVPSLQAVPSLGQWGLAVLSAGIFFLGAIRRRKHSI
ncbi:MAG: IPTL-CTERM sorting domain-containing protein [Comamonadaceae bacterium]|nr:IPTL-CTERM sorting domain-containing protein [Comamonadaceae bacterium]